MTSTSMTGKKLRNIATALGLFFWPLLFLAWMIPPDTWDKWAERYF